jgi:hypothetical protein
MPETSIFRHRGLHPPLLVSVSEPYPLPGEAKTKWSKARARRDEVRDKAYSPGPMRLPTPQKGRSLLRVLCDSCSGRELRRP